MALFVLVAYISHIPYLNWTLYGILSIYVALSLPTLKRALSPLRNGLWVWCMIVLAVSMQYVVFSVGHYDDEPYLRYIAISILNILVFLSVISFAYGDPSRLIRLSRLFFIALTLSAIVYFLGIPFKGMMLEFKKMLYPGSLLKYEQSFKLHNLYSGMWNSGLTSQLFLFGYHCAAGLAFSVAALLFQKRHTLFRVGMAIFFLLVSFVSAERSVIFAIVVSLAMLMVFYRKAFFTFISVKYAVSAVVLTSIVFGAFALQWLTSQQGVEGPLLTERFGHSDIAPRIQLQAAAFAVLQEYPFGIFLEGYRESEWGSLAGRLGYNVPIDVDTGESLEIHNSYLRFVMMFGVFSVLLIIVVYLWYIVLISRIISQSLKMKREFGLLAQTQISLVLVFLAMVFQAFFHNDSLFTFEPVTWLITCIVASVGLQKRLVYDTDSTRIRSVDSRVSTG